MNKSEFLNKIESQGISIHDFDDVMIEMILDQEPEEEHNKHNDNDILDNDQFLNSNNC